MARTERKGRRGALSTDPVLHGACAVCGERDARLLVMVELRGGTAATLCGSHALLHSRIGEASTNLSELRTALCDRRAADRRAKLGDGGDELAERLTRAFSKERRGSERRAG
jgi:hypothetical protein